MLDILLLTYLLITRNNLYYMRKQLRIFIIVFFCSAKMFSQQLAIGTDLMLDVLQTPNLGFELVVGERSTLSLNAFGNYKPWGADMQMLAVQPEYRYYFGGRPMHRMFVGAGTIFASYDITYKSKIYDGAAGGVGLTFGYVFNITNRLNIDAHAGFGLIGYEHKEYYVHDHYEDFMEHGYVRHNATGYYTLPTRIGISLTYIFR